MPARLIDRLGTADVKPEEDETLWWIPLELKTVDESGKSTIDHEVFLTDREMTIPIKNVKNVTLKVNAETAGVCKSIALHPRCLLSEFRPRQLQP